MKKTKILLLLTVLLCEATSAWATWEEDWTDDQGIVWFMETGDNSGWATIKNVSGASGAIYIPEKITYKGKEHVVQKKDSWPISFQGNGLITSFRSDCDFTFGTSAFKDCTYLVSVQADKWTVVPHECFRGCMRLETASFQSATKIQEMAFRGCTSMKSISCPAVTEIWAKAFYCCYELTKFEGPNVTSIDKRLNEYGGIFYDCQKLNYIYLPKLTGTDLSRNVASYNYKPFYYVPDNTLIYVKDDSTVGSGDYNVVLCHDDGTMTCPDFRLFEGKDYVPKRDLGNFNAEKVTYERSLLAGGVYTIFVPYKLPTMDGVKYYTLSKVQNGKFYFNEVYSTAKATKYLVVCSQDVSNFNVDETREISVSLPGSTKVVANQLYTTGTYSNRKEPNVYILQAGNKWMKTSTSDGDEVYVPPFRFYIEYTGSSSATEMGTRFGDATDIEAICTTDLDGTEQWYDLQGHPVDAPRKGLNIVNGKKVFIN